MNPTNSIATYLNQNVDQIATIQADPQSFALPHSICDLNLIRRQLGCPNLNHLQILSMARDALLHGRMEAAKVSMYSQLCHKFVHQNMLFVLSEGFDAVVTIIWDKDTQIIGNHTTQTHNDFECMLDEQCIDEIVNHLDRDMDSSDCDCDCMYPPLPIAIPPTSSSPDIKISDALYTELNARLFGNQFHTKQELRTHIQTAVHAHNVPMRYIGEKHDFCVWIDTFYVYCTLRDESTLCDIFDYAQFQKHYAQCYESLIQRRLHSNYCHGNSSCNTSKRSVFTDVSEENKNSKGEYHTIYLKPIIERMKANTHTIDSNIVDTEFIIDIVDNSIKYGAKRQISKRTFEFKWQTYTIIMSKSLKTILDVTRSADTDVITVHPDVVSIISKKCPVLEYATIQRLANEAKVSSGFTTKKNDYRQQFIYDFCGCRIVFASNHTTIVEMQCNDAVTLNDAVCNERY